MTGEIARIEDDLRRAYEGGAWHGPALREVLAGVSSGTAAARPVPGGHTIWEIVGHLAAWDGIVARRITESLAIEMPEEGNFPSVTAGGPPAWDQALAELDHRHRALREVVARLDPSRLDETAAGKDYSLAVMLHGVAQHMAYHGGQIALLRKLAAG